ncbi:general secretion pathway protein GspK [Halodesulfovibrio aestuarii]|uniref:Type II secretion system (T2SS), protein K n=1 Tax=Halodesulfovibrio aestuarii TaxID=126333 RepID=A0A8G2CA89_9BACT|nr:type II secretion system protein GspK [Halodesulfovibrio aestuarii]SHJ27743.1 Type II secretion system (T2SS), protein K [Halodesulfovibrio aestuarii]
MRSTATPPACNKEQGAIIIIILLVLVILSFLAMELSKETLIDHTSSAVVKSSIAGNALCDSGRLLAKEILITDLKESSGDYNFEAWGSFDSELKEISKELVSGSLSGEITDENALFPINKLALLDQNTKQQTEQYQAIFLRMLKTLCTDLDITSGTPEDLMTSIRIWQGEELARASEDDTWYLAQETAYTRTKKPFRSPSEILLLYWPNAQKGDLEKLYYGTDAIKGLRDLITVWGRGPINMNTACDALVYATPSSDEHEEEFLAQATAYRNDPANNFETAWYLNTAKLCGIQEKDIPNEILSFKTNTFRVNLTAQIGSAHKREVIILRRTIKKITLLGSYGE